VVGFLLQLDAVSHAEPVDHLARELEAAGPVQHRVLAGVHGGLAVFVGGGPPDRSEGWGSGGQR
jgi:hypothetical protein